MEGIHNDFMGILHISSSMAALVCGSMVLLARKGTVAHKRVGYAYFFFMLLVNLSAFGIYRLYGTFGLFHYAALASLSTTLMGIVPLWTKRPRKHWRFFHISFSYWSVIGLWIAFVAEMLTRIPETPFYSMVGLAFVGITVGAGIGFRRKREFWKKQIGIR